MEKKITEVQEYLTVEGIDGWLLYDFNGINPIAGEILQLTGIQTRRWFYWIPATFRESITSTAPGRRSKRTWKLR